MSILSGFFKTKRYRMTENGYKLQSEWTSSDTVEFENSETLTDKINTIENKIPTIITTTSDPGEETTSSHKEGTIICVYE